MKYYNNNQFEPYGIGLYIRGLSQEKHGTPAQAAKKAKDNGVSFVAIMTMWQDRHNGKDRELHSNGRDGKLIAKYAEAFRKQGIKVLLWGFPRGGFEDSYVDRFVHVTGVCGGTINGWLHDPEVFYKWKGKAPTSLSVRGQPEYIKGVIPGGHKAARISQAEKLMKLTIDAMHEGLSIGITSYGMAMGHPNFPWGIFGGYGWGSPQLYSPGPKDIDRGIAKWRELGWDCIVPSVPTFGKNSGANLHDHLSNFVDGEEDIDGFIFWSWRQTSRDEWRVLARWADWLKANLCQLGPIDRRY